MKKLFVVLFGLILFAFTVNPAFGSQSFYFPHVSIAVAIHKDATVGIVEKRTFHFSGDFTRVYWDIPLTESQQITNVSIDSVESSGREEKYTQLSAPDAARPPLHFAANRTDNTEHIEAYDTMSDGDKTFILSYTIHGALQKYLDVGQFYWKVIGDQWNTTTDSVDVSVSLPQGVGKNNIHVWGHGPLDGNVTILDGKTTTFSVQGVDANQFVEVRETFPSSIIAGAPIPKKALPTILAEEHAFQVQLQQKVGTNLNLLLLFMFLLIVWVIVWIGMWFRYGKEYTSKDVPKYVTSPPSKLAPALVEALVTQDRKITGNAFSATILDLARRKIILIEETETYHKGVMGLGSGTKYAYTLRLLDENYSKNKSLTLFERSLISFIFPNRARGTTITLDALKESMRNAPSTTYHFYKDWTDYIKKLGSVYIEPRSKVLKTIYHVGIATLYILCLIQFSYLIANFQSSTFIILTLLLFLLSIPIFVVFTLFSNSFLRWTKSAELQAREWLAFKKYLEDFSDFKNEVPHAVIIWEDMLVYGTALGVAKKVTSYLPIILKQPSAHTNIYWYHSAQFNSGINSNFAAAFFNLNTSFTHVFGSGGGFAGAGGGFSGGGGGGGGGGAD